VARSVEGVRGFRANRALLPVLGLFVAGLTLSAVYVRTGLGVPCPFRLLTGWDCALCGSTRMGGALLHGHLAEAFFWNPVVFVTLAALAALGMVWTVEAVTGSLIRRTRPLAAWIGRVSAAQWLLASVGLALVYTLARNLF